MWGKLVDISIVAILRIVSTHCYDFIILFSLINTTEFVTPTYDHYRKVDKSIDLWSFGGYWVFLNFSSNFDQFYNLKPGDVTVTILYVKKIVQK